MDASIIQLFAADETHLVDLHACNRPDVLRYSRTLNQQMFFSRKGMIVAAVKGEAQGEAALRQIIDWKDTLFIWEPDIVAPIPPRLADQI